MQEQAKIILISNLKRPFNTCMGSSYVYGQKYSNETEHSYYFLVLMSYNKNERIHCALQPV